MTPGWIGFIIGMFVGVIFGFVVLGLWVGPRLAKLEATVEMLEGNNEKV